MSFSNFEIVVVIDLSLMKLCSAKRSEAKLRSEDKSCFQTPQVWDEVETLRRGQDSWERESDAEMKTQELKLRSERQSAEETSSGWACWGVWGKEWSGERSWGECRLSQFLGLQTLLSGESEQWLRSCLYVLTLPSKSISFQVVARFYFMADLVRKEEVLRTHSLAAAF